MDAPRATHPLPGCFAGVDFAHPLAVNDGQPARGGQKFGTVTTAIEVAAPDRVQRHPGQPSRHLVELPAAVAGERDIFLAVVAFRLMTFDLAVADQKQARALHRFNLERD